jgi:hypothetical protein
VIQYLSATPNIINWNRNIKRNFINDFDGGVPTTYFSCAPLLWSTLFRLTIFYGAERVFSLPIISGFP